MPAATTSSNAEDAVLRQRKQTLESINKSSERKSDYSNSDNRSAGKDKNVKETSKTSSKGILFHFKNSPFISNMIFTFVMAIVGNSFVQQFVLEDHVFSYDKLIRFSLLKCVLVALIVYPWTCIFNRKIGYFAHKKLFNNEVSAKNTLIVSLIKLSVDQICFSPCMCFVHLTSLHYVDAVLDKGDFNPLNSLASYEKWHAGISGSLAIWPGAQLVNLTMVPEEYQLGYVQCVAVVWNAWLSFVSK